MMRPILVAVALVPALASHAHDAPGACASLGDAAIVEMARQIEAKQAQVRLADDSKPFPGRLVQLDKTVYSVSLAFSDDGARDNETLKLGAAWQFRGFEIAQLSTGQPAATFVDKVLPDKVNFQVDVSYQNARTYLAQNRSRTERIEIFPLQFTYDLNAQQFQPYFKLGYAWRDVRKEDRAAGQTERSIEDETSWKLGIGYKPAGRNYAIALAHTWRFSKFWSDKSSDGLDLSVQRTYKSN